MAKNEIVNYSYNLEYMSPVYPTQNVIYTSKKKNEDFNFSSLRKNKSKAKDSKKSTIYTLFIGDFSRNKRRNLRL